MLSIRFTPEEMEQLRAEAEREGVPVSAYVRRFALARPVVLTSTGTHPNNTSSGSSMQIDYDEGRLKTQI